ncbi:hypothetical protein ACHAPC_004001 [Botrytis cinerea]
MFFLYNLERQVTLHPSYFGRNMHELVTGKLLKDVEGTCTGLYYIITIMDTFNISEGRILPGSGLAEFTVGYRAVVWRPFKGETVDAIVTSVNAVGFFADAGPLPLFVSAHLIPRDIKFDANATPPQFTNNEDSVIEPGTHVRVKIIGTRPEVGAMFAIGSIKEDYLGCKNNRIECHHRSFIGATAVQKTKILEESDIGRCKCLAIEPTIPPPKPETYTAHLAVLRNPTHKEWKSRPHRYLSPALCNVSPHYVQRFVEPAVRETLRKGDFPEGRHEFTLAKAQQEVMRFMHLSGVKYIREKRRYAERASVLKKESYEFEQQVEILMMKLQEIRWKRKREEELCVYLEDLVGVRECAEQKREFGDQKREFLLSRERLKRERESGTCEVVEQFQLAHKLEDRDKIEKLAQRDEEALGELEEFLEELDVIEWRERERGKLGKLGKKWIGGGEKGDGDVKKNVETEWMDESLSLFLDNS